MNYKKITLVQIEYFLALARYLNFTEAAKNLYISQPSLSKQIALLESSIGVELFYRSKRDVRLTEAGRIFVDEVNGVIQVIESSIEKCRDFGTPEKTTVNIGYLEAIETNKILLPIIMDIKERYPDVELVIEKHYFDVLREGILNGRFDIIFTLSFEIDNSIQLMNKIMLKGNGMVVMNVNNPLAKNKKISVEQLRDEDFLITSREVCPRGFDYLVNLCRENGFIPKVKKQLPNLESLLISVEIGMGVAIVDSNTRINLSKNIKTFLLDEDKVNVVGIWRKENIDKVEKIINHKRRGIL